MLKIRTIPTLLWKDFGLVKGERFNSWRRVGSVLPAIKVYNLRGVDELVLLDIAATERNVCPDYDAIENFSAECFVPLTVGGGITKKEHVKELLRAGADKVCINTAAYARPALIRECADTFGAQCIVVSIDVRKLSDNQYECYSHSGKVATGLDPVSWAKQAVELGAGEILLTSIDRDGTYQGYDIELIRQVANNVNTPVIASGGASTYEDFYQAIIAGASAVSAASIFHFTKKTPNEAKKYLSSKHIPVRHS